MFWTSPPPLLIYTGDPNYGMGYLEAPATFAYHKLKGKGKNLDKMASLLEHLLPQYFLKSTSL
jgi:hypothetical protein